MTTAAVDSTFPELLMPVALRLGLRDGASAEVPSRVSDIEEQDGALRIVVARPDVSDLVGAGTYPHPGEEIGLLWTHPAGQMLLPVTAEAASRPFGPVWVLTPRGAAVREQRRQYFRVPLSLPARLSHDDSVDRVTIVDISEGGAQVTCEALPEVGTEVLLGFSLHDTIISLEAEVLRHSELPNGRPAAALRFLDPRAYGDHIRRFAFEVQRARARTQGR
jgi:hypothetical protein